LVNAIYWAIDDPFRPKSHDSGALVQTGITPPPDALLCIQGPLTLRRHPRWLVFPTLEVGELAGYAPSTPRRTMAWLDAAPRIGNSIFVKLFTHGAAERNAGPLLGGFIDNALHDLRIACDTRGFRLLYASAWELTGAVRSAALLPPYDHSTA
jgi:hypothetical protein